MPIQKATKTPSPQHLHIFGKPFSGRTHQAIEAAMPYKRVLYVGFLKNALRTFTDKFAVELPDDWDSIIVREWLTFKQDVVEPLHAGKFQYDCIVLDDYDAGYEYVLDGTANPKQADYLRIANVLAMAATKIISSLEKNQQGRLIMTTQVMTNDEDKPRHYLSAANTSRLFPKFSVLNYCVYTGKKMTVQTRTVSASQFIVGKPITLKKENTNV